MTSPSDTIPRAVAQAMWREMTRADIPDVHRLAQRIHPPDLDETSQALQSRLELGGPSLCRILSGGGGGCVGYMLAHPWCVGDVPPLGAILERTARQDTLFLHDLAILAEHRSRGFAGQAIGHLKGRMRDLGLSSIALVAVSGTGAYWRSHGFEPSPAPSASLAPYGREAAYLLYSAT